MQELPRERQLGSTFLWRAAAAACCCTTLQQRINRVAQPDPRLYEEEHVIAVVPTAEYIVGTAAEASVDMLGDSCHGRESGQRDTVNRGSIMNHIAQLSTNNNARRSRG